MQLLSEYKMIINFFFILKTGVLAIAKPCTIVVSIKELYGSESKSQVYGHLHELLQHSDKANIGMF